MKWEIGTAANKRRGENMSLLNGAGSRERRSGDSNQRGRRDGGQYHGLLKAKK
jgi:hypothetical protein